MNVAMRQFSLSVAVILTIITASFLFLFSQRAFAQQDTMQAMSAQGALSTTFGTGSRGPEVSTLQSFLESKGFLTLPSGVSHGFFGALTRQALPRYQSSVGLPPVGYFGARTRMSVNLARGNDSQNSHNTAAAVMVNNDTPKGDVFTNASPDPIPPPSNVGTNIPLSYQGPAPSEVDKKLVGPVKLLRAGTFDQAAGTITLPLYLGHMKDGKNVWYILTDTDDERNAEA